MHDAICDAKYFIYMAGWALDFRYHTVFAACMVRSESKPALSTRKV
jgi:hypothetical protein